MEAPAPAKLAPFAAAVAASVEEAGNELARGRLIVLYDPEGHEAWDGCLRLVTYIRTELEDELVTDPMLPGGRLGMAGRFTGRARCRVDGRAAGR